MPRVDHGAGFSPSELRERLRALAEELLEEEECRTSLQTYLEACQRRVLAKIDFYCQPNLAALTSTEPMEKHCPKWLLPWGSDFSSAQQAMIHQVECLLSDEDFSQRLEKLACPGTKTPCLRVADKESLAFATKSAVLDPVQSIMSELNSLRVHLADGTYIHQDVTFEAPPNTLLRDTMNEPCPDVDDQPDTESGDQDDTDTEYEDGKGSHADIVCAFRGSFVRNSRAQNDVAYIISHFAPHNLNERHLQQGLGEMDPAAIESVIGRTTIPEEAEAKFQYYAEALSLAAVCEVYHHMIEAGLQYGLLTTGYAFVFLRIDWSDPTRLYHYRVTPQRQMIIREGDTAWKNAVSYVLAFTLMAWPSRQRDNDARSAAAKSCAKWVVDFDTMVERIALYERQLTSGDGPLQVPLSPLRASRRLSLTATPQYRGKPSTTPNQHPPDTSKAESLQGQSEKRKYCTPDCLLSLVSGSTVDTTCPNVQLHLSRANTPGPLEGQHHTVTLSEWKNLLQQQLAQSVVRGVVRLNKHGSTGAMFQLTLLQYGYTFMAKGVTGRCVPNLEHEEAAYEKLHPLQGHDIPVCLGRIDLKALEKAIFYDFDVRMIHLLLLSYGGSELKPVDCFTVDRRERIASIVKDVLRRMHELGVTHGDISQDNVLLNSGKITMVDLGRSVIGDVADPREVRDDLFEANELFGRWHKARAYMK